MTHILDADHEGNGVLADTADLAGVGETLFKRVRLLSDLESDQLWRCGLWNGVVQVCPVESVKRVGTGCDSLFAESLYIPIATKVEFRFRATVHLLAMYNEGARRDGETRIDGVEPSRLRSVVNKLTFVPAGHAYREWHETTAPTRITFLYLDPCKLANSGEAESFYPPRVHFEDPIVWETAAKLTRTLESGQERQAPYLNALSSVLAHELARSECVRSREAPMSRGGLASWQKRVIANYIEEHLAEQICLFTLAGLARLSLHHFCRAFKQSFGIPPHQYHVQRRIERAKLLLADRTASITEIGLILGYSQTSSFSVAFRKMTGRTPSEYRRQFE